MKNINVCTMSGLITTLLLMSSCGFKADLYMPETNVQVSSKQAQTLQRAGNQIHTNNLAQQP